MTPIWSGPSVCVERRVNVQRLGASATLTGITSALSAPLFAGVPPTQRAVSDQVLICTGTGRKGKPTVPPEFVDTRTVVFLMALHRITGLVADLTTWNSEDAKRFHEDGTLDQSRKLWPKSTPCAVIERASCPDQRVIRTTLEYVAAAIEEEGSRPPGLLVLGAACEVLHKSECTEVGSICYVDWYSVSSTDLGDVRAFIVSIVLANIETQHTQGISWPSSNKDSVNDIIDFLSSQSQHIIIFEGLF